jgi:hypothetical protein
VFLSVLQTARGVELLAVVSNKPATDSGMSAGLLVCTHRACWLGLEQWGAPPVVVLREEAADRQKQHSVKTSET